MKTVTICSSNRFADEAEKFAKKLEKLGVNVLVPHFYTKIMAGLIISKITIKNLLPWG